MPGLGGFEVTLTDLLMARSAPLTEDELWAVLGVSCECLEDQMKRDKSTWASGPSLLITMDTLMLNRAGDVRFCPGFIAPDDPGSYAPPETVSGKYDVTRASVEKMYMYSLGMSLFTAAEFETDEGAKLGDELESTLLNMCEEAPECRFSIGQVQENCSEHARKSNCLPYSDKVSAMIESLMGSTAVLDTLGSMDDLDMEDATLEQEIAEALRMRTASMASVRSSVTASPHVAASPHGFKSGLSPHLGGSAGSVRSSPRTPIVAGEGEIGSAPPPRELPSPPTLTDEPQARFPPSRKPENNLKLQESPPQEEKQTSIVPQEESKQESHLFVISSESPPPPLPDGEPPPIPDSAYPDIDNEDGGGVRTEARVSLPVQTLEESGEMEDAVIVMEREDTSSSRSISPPVKIPEVAVTHSPVCDEDKGDRDRGSKPAIDPPSPPKISLSVSPFTLIPMDRTASAISDDDRDRDARGESLPVAQSTPATDHDQRPLQSWAGIQADLATKAAAIARDRDSSKKRGGKSRADGDRSSSPSVSWKDSSEHVRVSGSIELKEGGGRSFDDSTGLADTTDGTFDVSADTEPSPLKGAVLFNESGLTDEAASPELGKKRGKKEKKKKQKKEPPHLGTVYGDEWPSVKGEKSEKKVKTMFGPEFSRLHGDWKKPSVSLIGGGEMKVPTGRKLVSVVLLDGSQLSLTAEIKSTVGELLDLVMTHLSLKERFYFGLAVKKEEEIWFMDPMKKLKKYAPPDWKVQSQAPATFKTFFCLKYYIENLHLIKYTQTLHLFYLQMRQDIRHGEMYCHADSALILTSYALQADFGDCVSNQPDYFNVDVYIRPQVVEKLTEDHVKEILLKMHKQHQGLNQAQAQMEFVKEVQRMSEYGLAFYKVSKNVKDIVESTVLGLGVRGILLFELIGEAKTPTKKYTWQQIRWVTFKEKRFTVIPAKEKGKLHFHASHYKKARYLLQYCQELHKFQMLMTKRLAAEKEFADEEDGAPKESGESETDDDAKSQKSLLVTALTGSPPSKRAWPADLDKSAASIGSTREVKVIKMIKSEGQGMGLLIVGGYMPKTGEDYGVYVKTVSPGGIAAKDGRIQPGDRILEVNGQPLGGMNHAEVVTLMKESPPLIELVVAHKISSVRASVEEEIELPKTEPPGRIVLLVRLHRAGGSLGISVMGGRDTRQRDNVYVQDVAEGGAAAREGTMKAGDRILSVNGRSLSGLDHMQVVQSLKDAGEDTSLEIEREGHARPDSLITGYDSLAADGEVMSIDLTKGNKGMGFSLTGGSDVGRSIAVKKIFESGTAAKDGRLKPGDLLIEVNGRKTQSRTHSEVVAILRSAPQSVRLVVVRPKEIVAPVTPRIERSIDEPIGERERTAMGVMIAAKPKQPSPPSSLTPTILVSPDAKKPFLKPKAALSPSASIVLDENAELVEVFGEQLLGTLYDVELARGLKGFGFSVTSGARSGVDESVLRGCFVRVILADPAKSDGNLGPGDQILEVNGVGLKDVRHSEAVNMLRSSHGQHIRMKIVRRTPPAIVPPTEEDVRYETPSPPISPVSGEMPPLPPVPNPWYDRTLFIELAKEGQTSLGFGLYTMPNWGTSESGQMFDCVYVKRIDPSSAAGRDGRLMVNDRLLEVDRETVEGKAYYQVVNTLRRARGMVLLKVARQPKFVEETDKPGGDVVDDVRSARVLMPLKGRRPADSPGKTRHKVIVRQPEDFFRPEVNDMVVDDDDEVDGQSSAAPSADTFAPADQLSLQENRSVYNMDHLEEICQAVENHVNQSDKEFAALKGERSPAPSVVGRLPENREKNRFPNLVPFDHTRVKLAVDPGQPDYINASHVKLVVGRRVQRYICTQSPLKKTIDDFWRMIWEQKCPVIAMITGLVESGKEKCVRYWPNKPGSKMRLHHQTFEVTLESQHKFGDYISRVLKIRNVPDDKSRHVVHLQFTAWPEHGIPQDLMAMVKFVSAARKAVGGSTDSVTVHCGAGFGRTGVFLVTDCILGSIEEDCTVNVLDFVRSMRESRPNMVQTKDQYLFCYKAYQSALQSLKPKPDPVTEDTVITQRNGDSEKDQGIENGEDEVQAEAEE
eukprot:m.12210 g.12210  ORF g.12210 m.12210 type:complete len:2074 (+) comp23876_c0_seq1:117-6338(+)